ncbi:MAG: aminomethyl-transferring glycine dehydrogenase subunit GcvPB [Peptococcaceae bacterium]|jgi:glycine dehydrogenase subunit 2|nr:aminomethyl-transferring glycine dehydrogenase subunit GcvPB [Peptococcaceae bacterium]MDH7524313.1 aminomethyl-transferring glycine dehydrogenase subunit GcvPB [Peptococcaceae bacterium]
MEKLIFEKSEEGRQEKYLPPLEPIMKEKDLKMTPLPPGLERKVPPLLPQLTEGEVVRHYTRLSQLNYGVDTGFYPLGSCTMKYNPKINEDAASLPGFAGLHPYQPEETVQGALALMYKTQQYLGEIAGMDAVSLQPAAGAHGEFTGLLIIMAYHESRGQYGRNKVIVPDSSHGTNPATAALGGCEIIQLRSNRAGTVDLEELRRAVGEDTAALMLTNPSTLGLFERDILEIARIVHEAGGLLYYDGANMNAIMGYARPGDMGFDVVHFNLHKTFSAPHGGGGPGSGPVGVKAFLEPFLPVPVVMCDQENEQRYYLDYDRPQSIGKVKAFYGNFSVVVKAYTYISRMGKEGLKAASENAVLNANYLMAKLAPYYHQPFPGPCKHEFVITPKNLKEKEVRAVDIAKRLLDYGYHPPTVYFPLIVEEALMIEPAETESKETLDAFADAMASIAREAGENTEILHEAPHVTPVGRLDEVAAARKPVLRWRPNK